MSENNELIIPVSDGWTLRCGPGADHEWGGYVRIVNPAGREEGYWDKAEWGESPEEVMGAIFAMAIHKAKPMQDQYDQPVPYDLAVLSMSPRDLTLEEIEKVMNLRWYRPHIDEHPNHKDHILVGESNLREALNDDFETVTLADIGIPKLQAVESIEHVLHRFTMENGFYHA